MRAFLPALLLLTVLGPASAVTTPAAPVSADLQPLAVALAPLRTTKGVNQDRNAGPELTPVKQALRLWVEQQLPPVPAPDSHGIIHSLEAADLTALSNTLNRKLEHAWLSCSDSAPTDPGCVTDPTADEDHRGYIGDVQIGSLDYNRYLFVITGVGVRCGYDESFYLYDQGPGRKWHLLLASEQDHYGKDDYSPQNFLSVDVSRANAAWNDPAPPPLVVTVGFSPWCSSNWQMLYTRLWRASSATTTPKPLIDRSDELYMGDDFVAAARLTPTDLLLEFNGRSIEGDKLVRPHVVHYLIHPADRLERIAPVALQPNDFVEEWMESTPAEARRWIDPRASRAAVAKVHAFYANRFLFGEFDGAAKQCRSDPSLWQVGFAEQLKNGDDGPVRYFQVRWMAPYRFTFVRAGSHRFSGCDRVVTMPDNIGTLFPLHGWTP